MKIVKVLTTTLKSSLKTDGTTIVVQAFVDSDGNTVALSDFGGSYFYVVIKQGSKIEIIKCDGITQNADGSASLSIATSGRSIPPKSPFTGASTGKAFQTGAELIVTNDPATMAEFAQLGEDNAFTGDNTFSNFPTKTGSTTPTNDGHFVTLAYLNSVVLGDATVSALKSTVTFGEDVSEGDPVYFKTSDGKWWRAYANDAATCIGVQLGIADEDALADAAGAVVRAGRKGSFTGLTNGTVYLTDAGGVSDTAGSYIVHLGTAVAADTVYVDPKDGDREQFLSNVTGMIVPFAGVSVPSGFLACNGQLLNYADYPDLLNVIGVKYGLGSGTAFTVTAANDTIDITSHGFSNGDRFILSSTTTLPAGLSAETLYYVVEATTNTFKLSLTVGGAAIDITDAGTGTHYLHTQFKVPDLRGSVVVGSGQKSVTASVTESNTTVGTTIGTISAVSGGNITLSAASGLALGDTIIFSGTLPTGLSAGTQYYIAYVSGTVIRVHTSRTSALAGSYITPTTTTTGATAYKSGLFTTVVPIDKILQTGVAVTLSTSGTLPSGLTAGTYYIIRVSDKTFRLAKTYLEALDGIELSLADDGSGVSTITFTLTSRTVGDSGGEEEHQLTVAEMPAHAHDILANSAVSGTSCAEGGGRNDDGSVWDDQALSKGGDAAHNNMQPYVVANWIIKT